MTNSDIKLIKMLFLPLATLITFAFAETLTGGFTALALMMKIPTIGVLLIFILLFSPIWFIESGIANELMLLFKKMMIKNG